MSLSWKDEQPLTPRTSFDVYGSDLRKTTDDECAPPLNTAAAVQQTPPIHQAPPTIGHTEVKPAPKKGKEKCWLLRPVAWLAFLISVGLMNTIINTTFLLIAYVVDWLSTLPTMAVILLTLAFGGFAIGLLFTGTTHLVFWVMSASHSIYPSKNGARFYIVGALQLFISLLSIILTLTDPTATHILWDCVTLVYFAIVYIVMLCCSKSITG